MFFFYLKVFKSFFGRCMKIHLMVIDNFMLLFYVESFFWLGSGNLSFLIIIIDFVVGSDCFRVRVPHKSVSASLPPRSLIRSH